MYVASSAARPLPTFLAEWIVPAGMNRTSPAVRVTGGLLLRQPETAPAEAEAWLQRALAVARRQEAKSLELRAAMSLARLWQQQGKRQAAHDLLAPVYGWFTEGFDTADLQEAKVLLEELGDKTGVHITR
jgi:predicted ATPase